MTTKEQSIEELLATIRDIYSRYGGDQLEAALARHRAEQREPSKVVDITEKLRQRRDRVERTD